MKVAVLCEFSGIVRDAFIAAGHNAISCDLLPTESPGPHIQGDCHNYDWSEYDLIIAHPPCTYLSYAARGVWYAPGREEKRLKALNFFVWIYNLPVKKLAIENPLGFPQEAFRMYDQKIHPYYFGDPFQKSICLWLKNLPPLQYAFTDELFMKKTACEKPNPVYIEKSGKPRHFTDAIRGFDPAKRRKERSKFFPGIATAMAEQWGTLECSTF